GSAIFQEYGTTYGATGMTTSGPNLFFTASGGLTSYAFAPEKATALSVAGAQEIVGLEKTASVCPLIGAGYSFADRYNVLTVPMGIGIGRTLPLGAGGSATLTPHVTPQFV